MSAAPSPSLPAEQRLEEFLRELSRRTVDDLIMIALPLPTVEARLARLDAADERAAAIGRADLVRDARERTRRLLVDAFARRAYDPNWFGLNWGRSLGRSNDRAALIAAAEDAAVAIVLADSVEPSLVEELAAPFETVLAMEGAAPAANPVLGERVGLAARVVLVVVATLTLGVAIVGQLLGLLAAWLERNSNLFQSG